MGIFDWLIVLPVLANRDKTLGALVYKIEGQRRKGYAKLSELINLKTAIWDIKTGQGPLKSIVPR